MTDDRVRSEGALNRGVTIAGQNKVDARSRDANAIANDNKHIQQTMQLRKEFNDLPPVKNYQEVVPLLNQARSAPNTSQGDIALIYAVGKIYDPQSVVREGEMNLVIKSGSPEERIKGFINYLTGGGRMTPAARANMIKAMESSVKERGESYKAAKTRYERIAEHQGIAKDQLFIEQPDNGILNAAPAGRAAIAPSNGWSAREIK
jgi:hypothetical protein